LTPHNSACYNLKSTLGGDIIYAIVEAGGKQYRVAPKQTIQVDHLDASTGKTVELDRVLLISDGQDTLVGTPTIEGAKVVASSMGEVKGDKLAVFKYKNKTRYRKKTGHRPIYTRLSIEEVVRPEA
jgi:large subunit ribosomal protein L21